MCRFNWSAHDPGHPDTWNGLYHNLSDPSVNVSQAAMSYSKVRTTESGDVLLAVPFFFGMAWQAFDMTLNGTDLAATIKGCIQNEGLPASSLSCVNGLVSTVIGVGGVASAAKTLAQSRGAVAVAASTWDHSGLEIIALNGFSRREVLQTIDPHELAAQKAHNHFVHRALSSLAEEGSEVDFVGYAPENHRLARRTSTEHPLAPMFRFKHRKYGRMEVTSRDTGPDGIYFTVSYAGHDTHLATKAKRDEFYQHERLDGSNGLVEGRFDSDASNADSATIQFDAAGGFDQIESTVACIVGDKWLDGNVLSVQMFDQGNQATFGFASVGLFSDDSFDSGLEDFTPSDMPLPRCE